MAAHDRMKVEDSPMRHTSPSSLKVELNDSVRIRCPRRAVVELRAARVPRLKSVCGLLVLALVPACSAADLVRKRAGQDFGCDPGSVIIEEQTVAERSPPFWFAKGCGRQNAYSTTGEWGIMWAVPCDRGADAGVPRPRSASVFDAAPAKYCEAVLSGIDGG